MTDWSESQLKIRSGHCRQNRSPWGDVHVGSSIGRCPLAAWAPTLPTLVFHGGSWRKRFAEAARLASSRLVSSRFASLRFSSRLLFSSLRSRLASPRFASLRVSLRLASPRLASPRLASSRFALALRIASPGEFSAPPPQTCLRHIRLYNASGVWGRPRRPSHTSPLNTFKSLKFQTGWLPAAHF